MNLSALPELLVNWLKGQGTEVLQPGKAQVGTQTAFQSGQQYEGQILQNLANGRSLVRVGQDTLDMSLPKGMQAGESIRLTYLNNTPRPTFLLDQTAPAASAPSIRLSGVDQQVSALLRLAQASAPAQAGGGRPVQGEVAPSNAAASGTRAIPIQVSGSPPTLTTGVATGMIASAGQAQAVTQGGSQTAGRPVNATGVTGQTASMTGAARPLVSNPDVLLTGVSTAPASVSAAVAGRVAIPAMAMAGQAVDGMRAALSPSTNLAAQGVTQAPRTDTHNLPVRLRQVVLESGMFYESHVSKWTRGELSLEAIQREPQARLARTDGAPAGAPELRGMSDEAARLAGRQLIILEGGPFVWQGQPWPGQEMEWLVEERQGRDGEGSEAGAQWHTEVRLVLPRMGEINAALELSATGLRVSLRASEPASLAEIRAAMPMLFQRMHAAQLNVEQIVADLAHEPAESTS